MPVAPVFYSTVAANQVRPYMPAAPVMVTATSFWSYGQRRLVGYRKSGEILPVKLPCQVPEVAADSGGFVAAHHLGGRYPFDFDAYVRWLLTIPNLTWAALPDLPVERELAASFQSIRERQELTLQWARELWGDDTEHEAVPWTWVPTIQGRDVADYVWMAQELAGLLSEQHQNYEGLAYQLDHFDEHDLAWIPQDRLDEAERGALHHRVGIGSLCRRRYARDVVDIVRAVADVLPGERFHLWGVKLGAVGALREAGLLERVVSLDSAAWNGRVGPRGRAEKNASTLSQAQHSWQVAWPRYLDKVKAQLHAPAPEQVQLGFAF